MLFKQLNIKNQPQLLLPFIHSKSDKSLKQFFFNFIYWDSKPLRNLLLSVKSSNHIFWKWKLRKPIMCSYLTCGHPTDPKSFKNLGFHYKTKQNPKKHKNFKLPTMEILLFSDSNIHYCYIMHFCSIDLYLI